MKFNTLLSALAVICSCVCCVNASGTVEVCFANDGSNKLGYSATYRNGMKSCSDGSDDISSLAGTINSIAGSYLSVGSSDVECFNCDMGSYSVGSNNGDFRDLVVLNDVKCNEGLKEVLFRGDRKNPTSIQMNFNNATDMKLPMVDCKNIGLLKFKINNDNSGNDVGYMAGLTVDAPVGLCYNKPIRVNGKKVNSASENLNVLCSIANRGTNQFKSPNGTKYKFGGASCCKIPGITDVLGTKGMYVTNIELLPNAPENAEKIGLRDINKLISGGAKVFAVNCNHKANGIIFSDQIFQANGIIKMICNSGDPIGFQIKSELAKKLLGGKTINDFIVIEVC